jgi:hypothetical protein
MDVITIIVLACVFALAWHCLKKPALKGPPARTGPASRGKLGAKPKFTPGV